jgi:hypothetical protein
VAVIAERQLTSCALLHQQQLGEQQLCVHLRLLYRARDARLHGRHPAKINETEILFGIEEKRLTSASSSPSGPTI